jgi:hypothetical protein
MYHSENSGDDDRYVVLAAAQSAGKVWHRRTSPIPLTPFRMRLGLKRFDTERRLWLMAVNQVPYIV